MIISSSSYWLVIRELENHACSCGMLRTPSLITSTTRSESISKSRPSISKESSSSFKSGILQDKTALKQSQLTTIEEHMALWSYMMLQTEIHSIMWSHGWEKSKNTHKRMCANCWSETRMTSLKKDKSRLKKDNNLLQAWILNSLKRRRRIPATLIRHSKAWQLMSWSALVLWKHSKIL